MESSQTKSGIVPISKEEKINQDPLAKLIVSLVNAMKADFGKNFASQFNGANDAETIDNLTNYKRRMYQKLKGRSLDAITNGYELFIDSKPKWPPAVPTLCGFVDDAEKSLKKSAENEAEAKRVAERAAVKQITCDPIKMLADVKSKPESEKTGRAEALQAHLAMLDREKYKYRRIFADDQHLCQAGGCNKAGSISSSTTGNGNFYCVEHYQAA